MLNDYISFFLCQVNFENVVQKKFLFCSLFCCLNNNMSLLLTGRCSFIRLSQIPWVLFPLFWWNCLPLARPSAQLSAELSRLWEKVGGVWGWGGGHLRSHWRSLKAGGLIFKSLLSVYFSKMELQKIMTVFIQVSPNALPICHWSKNR